ncbi:DoxX family protein [Arhodomonas sp. SL1]|uniref:DoxX family protein n=1 Tax=Arhodomonas sp. SL1 TaxID=3425691 RepID=UPI003F881DE3
MVDERFSPYAAFLLRVALGVMFLAHSVVLKLMTFGLPGTAQFFVSIGLPGWLAYVVFVMEAIGGAALVLGVQARWVALALAPILVGAIWHHSGFGWVFDAEGGGWEYPLYLTLLCFVQALIGDGRWALSPSRFPQPLRRLAGVA